MTAPALDRAAALEKVNRHILLLAWRAAERLEDELFGEARLAVVPRLRPVFRLLGDGLAATTAEQDALLEVPEWGAKGGSLEAGVQADLALLRRIGETTAGPDRRQILASLTVEAALAGRVLAQARHEGRALRDLIEDALALYLEREETEP